MQSDNSVAFKVSATLCPQNEDKVEVRRFAIDKSVVTNFEYLRAKLQNIYPPLKVAIFTVSWIDDENDDVTISSDDELVVALYSMKDDLKKLKVKVSGPSTECEEAEEIPHIFIAESNANPRKRPSDGPAQHYGVVCDSCEGPVVGFRYKCVTCEDYDLCGVCEGNKAHSEHFMLRIPVSLGPLKPRFARTVGHTLFKSLRRCGTYNPQNNEGQCPLKRQRGDRHPCGDGNASEGKHGRHERHGSRHDNRQEGRCDQGHEGPHEGRPEGRHGCPRGRHGRHEGRNKGGWFNTFATYMNEFANLADFPEAQANKPEASAPAASSAVPEATAPPASTPILIPTPANAPGENTNTGNATQESDLVDFQVKFLQNVGRAVAKMLDPHGIQVDYDIETGDSKATEPRDKTGDGPTLPSRENSSKPKDTNPFSKETTPQQASLIDIDSKSSVSDDNMRSSDSPDKADEWTILNDEPFEASTQGDNVVNPHKIGFDLDKMTKDFQKHMELENIAGNVATTSANSNTKGVYPNIESVTFVPMTVEPTVRETPKDPPAQTKPEGNQYRPTKPHIAEALDKMIAMGFKNEGGRLARLLEAKNGNISAVLDTLTMSLR